MQLVHRPLLALGFRLVSAIVLAAMFTMTKLLGERGAALPEVLFWRQAMTPVVLIAWGASVGRLGELKTRRIGAHVMRATLGMAAMAMGFASIRILHLSEATMLGFTLPLFAVLITGVFMAEKVGAWRWLAVGMGFAGILVVPRPGSSTMPLLGIAAGLGGAALGAINSFNIRELARFDSSMAVVFWFGLFGALFTAPLLPFSWHSHNVLTWAMLLGVGVLGTVAQLLLTTALRYGSVASVVVMDYTQLLWVTLSGWLVWGVLPDTGIWWGAPLIIASGLAIALSGHRQAAPAPETDQ